MDRDLHVRYLRWRNRRELSERADRHRALVERMGLDPDDRISFRTSGEIEQFMAREQQERESSQWLFGPPDEEFCQEFDSGFLG